MEGLKNLVNISQYYGGQKEYVIAGGGNTSFKTADHIWVKASGFALATITEAGFAKLDRHKLAKMSKKAYSADPFERERQVKDDLTEANLTKDKRPSVETSLHDLIDYSYIVHLHPTSVNGVMCSNDVEKHVASLFGADALYVPYIDPGYILFKEVEGRVLAYRKAIGFDPKVIVLQNHGIFVGANSVDEIKTIYTDILTKIDKAVSKPLIFEDLAIPQSATDVVPAIRMIVSGSDLKTLKIRRNKLVDHFTSSRETYQKINKPFTPDIIVYCKSEYIYVDEVTTPEAAIAQFKILFEGFVAKNGYQPKVLLIKGIGMVAVGDNAAQTDIILDVFEDMLKISWLSESFGGQHFMTAEQIRFIDTWEVENYRRSVAAGALRGRMENRNIIVTGAAQGFGEGIARGLKEQGANIIVADLNAEVGLRTVMSLNGIEGSNKASFVQTDVSKIEQIENLVNQTVNNFGGVDVFISNAGILRAGGLDEMTVNDFDLVTKINYNAYFYCAKAVSRVMKLQTAHKVDYYADIIQINSKSGLSGSKKNFAYAGGKFGGIGLTQSFALELAPDRIKVNSVCPGNFYDGPLWSDPVSGLFVQYLNAGKVPGAKTIEDVKRFYLTQTPIQRGCTTNDVLKAVMYLVDQEFETGQAIPVTGGQVMLN